MRLVLKVSKNYIETVSRTPLFLGIEMEDISAMLDCIKPKIADYNRNDIIVKAGDTLHSIGIILTGQAIVNRENAAGERIVLTILEQGETFGEVIAFSSQSRWPATVQAQDDCRIFFLPKDKIINDCPRMCPGHRILIQNFLREVSEKALVFSKKVEYLTIKSMKGKISKYLLEQYEKAGNKDFVLPLNRNALAEYLHVSRPSLSREMCQMRDKGIIDFHLTAIRILDLEALRIMSVK